jgi:hypothetical protein
LLQSARNHRNSVRTRAPFARAVVSRRGAQLGSLGDHTDAREHRVACRHLHSGCYLIASKMAAEAGARARAPVTIGRPCSGYVMNMGTLESGVCLSTFLCDDPATGRRA